MKTGNIIITAVVFVLVLLLAVGFTIKAGISIKQIVELPYSSSEIWKVLTDTDQQVFWRTDLINIVKIQDKKGPAWKEIYKKNKERVFSMPENVNGERMVRVYAPDSVGQETFTVIVIPSKNGCRVAFIDTIDASNPVLRLVFKAGLADQQKLFTGYNNFISMFTNDLRGNFPGTSVPGPKILQQTGRTSTN
jgi:hypothetical protein